MSTQLISGSAGIQIYLVPKDKTCMHVTYWEARAQGQAVCHLWCAETQSFRPGQDSRIG